MYLPEDLISGELLKTEVQNIPEYGYGVKPFVLSMIETAIKLSNNEINAFQIEKIINLGKELLDKPVEILDGVIDVLESLYRKYNLILATKGDLLEQKRKLKKSGLSHYFHHIEVMSEKDESEYTKVLKQLNIKAENFLMIGNSIKSDIIPVLNIGAYGFHVPYHITWELEKVDFKIESANFKQLDHLLQVLNYLN